VAPLPNERKTPDAWRAHSLLAFFHLRTSSRAEEADNYPLKARIIKRLRSFFNAFSYSELEGSDSLDNLLSLHN
jgi:hypothetical protein